MNKESYALYHKVHCPYCQKVISVMKSKNLNIELRDTEKSSAFNKELISKGGKRQVPCLKITIDGKDIWMYESGDIIKYLNKIA